MLEVAGTGAILGLGAVATTWFGLPLVSRASQTRRLARECRARGTLALTFDDGPSPSLTPILLDLLAAHGAKATFFFLGRAAARHAEIVRQARLSGHEVASHSFQHRHAWKCLPGQDVADLRRGVEALKDETTKPRLLRPPYGKLSLGGWLFARRSGITPTWWTVDSGDTWSPLPAPTDPVGWVEARGGGVVLLHDFERSGPEASVRHAFVLDVTEALLRLANRRGWRAIGVGEALSGEVAR